MFIMQKDTNEIIIFILRDQDNMKREEIKEEQVYMKRVNFPRPGYKNIFIKKKLNK